MEGKLGFLDLDLTIMNVYAPYKNRDCFWDSLSASDLLNSQNLILARDLNFTLSLAEIWGHNAKMDPMAFYFKNLLESFDLVDIFPPMLEPTWSNGRSGKDDIHKRLERFVVKTSLI